MLQFNKVILHNFGSYGHAEVNLQNRGFCLVSGRNNYKKDNAFSNGSGKSFLWSAICFALTGETINGLHSNLRNINADENDKKCYVTLEFYSNTEKYELTRIVSPSSDLKIIRNDIDVSGKGIRESEKKLGEYLPDLTKDLIASTIIIGQGMPNKFSSFSPSGRKELLEKLTKSDFMIDDLKQRVANRQSELNTKLREFEDSILVNKTQLITAEATLKKAVNERETSISPDYEYEINKANDQIAKISADLENANTGVTLFETKIEEINTKLLAITSEKATVSNEEITGYNEAVNKVNLEKMNLASKYNSLNNEIYRLKSIKDVCPTCGQKLQGVVKPNTDAQEKEAAELKEQIKVFDDKLKELAGKHIDYTSQISQEFDDKINQLNIELNNAKKDLNKAKNDSNDYSHYLALEQNKLTKLIYDRDNEAQRWQALLANIKAQEEAVAKLTALIKLSEDGKLELQEHIAVVKKMDSLIKRDFRGYLLSNIIAYIDKRAKDFSEIVFGTRELDVYLDGNALDIAYCGKMFDNLSGGEKQRVDLILQFAIRDMLMSYLNVNSNILVLDEITDFLDKQSCGAIMNLIEKELNTIESVFVISHHAEELELPIDSELHVIKNENGISEVF